VLNCGLRKKFNNPEKEEDSQTRENLIGGGGGKCGSVIRPSERLLGREMFCWWKDFRQSDESNLGWQVGYY